MTSIILPDFTRWPSTRHQPKCGHHVTCCLTILLTSALFAPCQSLQGRIRTSNATVRQSALHADRGALGGMHDHGAPGGMQDRGALGGMQDHGALRGMQDHGALGGMQDHGALGGMQDHGTL